MCQRGLRIELMDSNSTQKHSVGKKAYNCGVGVCRTGEGDIDNDYYGVLKHIIKLEYIGQPIK